MGLVDDVLRGSDRAAARIISLAEDGTPEGRAAMREVHRHIGKAHVVGITGAPGTGKSTLVDKLIDHCRGQGKTVGVVAVDPTSPFTGGAILGDRIRMRSRSTDPGVFIRSMGSRGALGGLSRATHDAVKVLDAMGKDIVLVETVGVGQGEVDVIRAVDTVVVVTVPGLGDEIQSIKAGIMEIGDLFIVNKADREGADKAAQQIEAMLQMGHPASGWLPPVLKTDANAGTGITEVAARLAAHMAFLREKGLLDGRRRDRREQELLEILKARLLDYVLDETQMRHRFDELVSRVHRGEMDPYEAADAVFDGFAVA